MSGPPGRPGRILQPFFGPPRIRAVEESLRAQAIDLVEAVKARGGCDFVADIAVPLPAQALLTLLGLPLEDRDRFIESKNAALELTDALSLGMERLATHPERRREPADAPSLSSRPPWRNCCGWTHRPRSCPGPSPPGPWSTPI